jgi:hypothetical protein
VRPGSGAPGGEFGATQRAIDRALVEGAAAEADLAGRWQAHSATMPLLLPPSGLVVIGKAVRAEHGRQGGELRGVGGCSRVGHGGDRPADGRVTLDGDAQLVGEVAVAGVVVAALATGALTPRVDATPWVASCSSVPSSGTGPRRRPSPPMNRSGNRVALAVAHLPSWKCPSVTCPGRAVPPPRVSTTCGSLGCRCRIAAHVASIAAISGPVMVTGWFDS